MNLHSVEPILSFFFGLGLNTESCGPSFDSLPVDSLPLFSKSGGGKTKSELQITKSESQITKLQITKSELQITISRATSQLRQKFLRLQLELQITELQITKSELQITKLRVKSQLRRKFLRSKSKMRIAMNLNTMSTKTAQILVSKEIRTKKVRLTDQFWKIKQHRRQYSSLCYGKDSEHFVEGSTIHSLAIKQRMKNEVCHMLTYLLSDEPTKWVQNVNSIQGENRNH